ncbi:MAG TPA: SAM-dependent methyltransferase [Thermoanaerobaculia bacterium]|nr:SAM-dependent methyltransferase [Thermoanaerobaculia bacterium]
MDEDRPSATSYRVAVRRAAHQILDDPRVFEDPLALAILGAERGAVLRSNLDREETRASRVLRAFIAVRSRYAEDELARAFRSGVRQAVILGAGLDTFAYRNPFPELRTFEVDHPATQAWKRRRLAEAQIPVPESLTFVPVDFERQTLATELVRAGFETSRAAFFSWLGVTPYLTEGAILATLGFIASLPSGSGVVFDYAVPPDSLSFWHRRAYDALASRVAAHGEPFRTFFDPPALAEQLGQLGFGYVEDLGTEEINERYFQDRSDGLRVAGEMGRLLAARV